MAASSSSSRAMERHDAESQGYADEHPQHSVRVAPFLVGEYPVTQEQWAAVMDWSPPYRCQGAKRPVDRVPWHDPPGLWRSAARLEQAPDQGRTSLGLG